MASTEEIEDNKENHCCRSCKHCLSNASLYCCHNNWIVFCPICRKEIENENEKRKKESNRCKMCTIM